MWHGRAQVTLQVSPFGLRLPEKSTASHGGGLSDDAWLATFLSDDRRAKKGRKEEGQSDD